MQGNPRKISKLGRRLKALRKRSGMTQLQLAESSGAARNLIIGLERGHQQTASLESCEKIAAALRCTLDMLAGFSPADPLEDLLDDDGDDEDQEEEEPELVAADSV